MREAQRSQPQTQRVVFSLGKCKWQRFESLGSLWCLNRSPCLFSGCPPPPLIWERVRERYLGFAKQQGHYCEYSLSPWDQVSFFSFLEAGSLLPSLSPDPQQVASDLKQSFRDLLSGFLPSVSCCLFAGFTIRILSLQRLCLVCKSPFSFVMLGSLITLHSTNSLVKFSVTKY